MVFVAVGLLLGPEVVLIDPACRRAREGACGGDLAVVLFADASRIDLRALRGQVAVPRLLGIGLPLTLVAGFARRSRSLGALSWPGALLAVVLGAHGRGARSGGGRSRGCRRRCDRA